MHGNILVSYRYKQGRVFSHLVNSHFVNSHFVNTTKWELMKWEVDKVGIDNVTDDKVHCKEIGWFKCVHEIEG